MLESRCATCGKIHRGVPSFGFDFPIPYQDVPEDERGERCSLSTDDCVIDEQMFFVRGSLEIPVTGIDDIFSWGVWVSLSESSYTEWSRTFDIAERSDVGPFFGWLVSDIWTYPNTFNLKTCVHLRNNGIRPFIELEPTDHPLAVEQRDGISIQRAEEIFEIMTHGLDSA